MATVSQVVCLSGLQLATLLTRQGQACAIQWWLYILQQNACLYRCNCRLSGLQLATVYSRQTTHRASPKFRNNNSVFGLFSPQITCRVPCVICGENKPKTELLVPLLAPSALLAPTHNKQQQQRNSSDGAPTYQAAVNLPSRHLPFRSATTKSMAAAVSVTSVNTVSRVGRSSGSLQPVHHQITSLAFPSFTGSRRQPQHPLSRSP